MIRIRTDRLVSGASELREQMAGIGALRERTASLLAQVVRQPHHDGTQVQIRAFSETLEEIESAYAQLADVLESIGSIVQGAEKKVIEAYESEQPAAGSFIVGRTDVHLYPDLERIAAITFRDPDTQEGK